MTPVYLALGSNVGDARAEIAQAIELLSAELQSVQCAPLYTSRAVGYTDQDDFINTALSAETSLSPLDLLHFIKQIEQQVGRVERFRWGPREIDIDIIFFGSQRFETPELTIPHPRFSERDFVLQPLADLAPELVDPVSGQTVTELLEQLGDNEHAILQKVD